jgi:hypothetical protein
MALALLKAQVLLQVPLCVCWRTACLCSVHVDGLRLL